MAATEQSPVERKAPKRRATVIYRRDQEILFVRKRKAKWNLPGGRVEQDETPLQAALREMSEETGLDFDQLYYVSEYEQNNVIHFLFETSLPLRKKPKPCNEIADCRWFTAKELEKRNVHGSIKALLRHCAPQQGA